MAGGVTRPILNPESVSQYDGLYEIGHFHAEDTHQKAINQSVFFKLLV
jgi:hypothetical protein